MTLLRILFWCLVNRLAWHARRARLIGPLPEWMISPDDMPINGQRWWDGR